MSKYVVIVESPAKSKTINKFMGKDYTVTASYGHVRDLPVKKLGVDIENGFKPEYVISKGKKKTVTSLKKVVKSCECVYLAPDPDREGEAIAWHLLEALNVPEEKAFRVTFNEITRRTVSKAFQSPAKIDMNKVDAQQTRRILDRIVGYKLSPLLWKKIAKGLSAGRVQSVAVRFIVEREKEIEKFKPEEYWKITANLTSQDDSKPEDFSAILREFDGEKFKATKGEEAESIVSQLKGAEYVISSIKKKEQKNRPKPPFRTSTLQQTAANRLHFSAKKTMMVAQQLYEGVELGEEGSIGLITYMRTDSFRIAAEALEDARKLIDSNYGKDYLPEKPNFYASGKSAQEGHEAIRPTDVTRTPEEIKDFLSTDQYKLYNLIWNRFVASQMTPARLALTAADIQAGKGVFRANGREVIFDGYTKLISLTSDDQSQVLPALDTGEKLDLLKLDPTQHFTQPPPRYTEASLVRLLEKKRIGRPSTYATIISTIQQRGYVRMEKRRFFATDLGTLVNDKLVAYFPRILDAGFTADMESRLDSIETGGADSTQTLKEFYDPFLKELDYAKENMESAKNTEHSEEKCELCGKPMLIRWSRKGKFLGCSGFPECKSTKNLGDDGEPAQELEEKCPDCGAQLVIKTGRRGKFAACPNYPECKNSFSLNKEGKPIILEKREIECDKCGGTMILRAGRRGPFFGCKSYPKCKNTKSLAEVDGKKDEKKDEKEEAGKDKEEKKE